jgi:hypothetical protein
MAQSRHVPLPKYEIAKFIPYIFFWKRRPKVAIFPPKAMRFCKRKTGPKAAMFPKTKPLLIVEFSLKSSCLHPVFGPLFTPLSPL